jgi:CRISPR system Cascade subunit CasE
MNDTLYLSRLDLSPRSRQVRAEIADPYQMHRTLSQAFHGDSENVWDEARCLFRIEDETTDRESGERAIPVLVQTRRRPDWSHHTRITGYLIRPAQIKTISFRRDSDDRVLIPVGAELTFRLVANPTVKRDGKRIGLYKEGERLQWLERKAIENGFRVTALRVQDRGSVRCRTATNEQAVFSAVQFDGALQVNDAEKFAQAWTGGIGAGKGVGFGLISLSRKRVT